MEREITKSDSCNHLSIAEVVHVRERPVLGHDDEGIEVDV